MFTNLDGKFFYSGKIGKNLKYLPSEYIFIAHAWQNQRSRCYNKKNKSYEKYGKKGFKVHYSLRELIGWFYLNKTKDVDKKNIGRIDHNKGYSLDNIRLETKSFSSKERIQRLGTPLEKLKIKVTNKRTLKVCIIFGLRNAAKAYNINHKTISRYINNETINPKHEYIFERLK